RLEEARQPLLFFFRIAAIVGGNARPFCEWRNTLRSNKKPPEGGFKGTTTHWVLLLGVPTGRPRNPACRSSRISRLLPPRLRPRRPPASRPCRPRRERR